MTVIVTVFEAVGLTVSETKTETMLLRKRAQTPPAAPLILEQPISLVEHDCLSDENENRKVLFFVLEEMNQMLCKGTNIGTDDNHRAHPKV